MSQMYTQWHKLQEAMRLKRVGMRMPTNVRKAVIIANQRWCDYDKLTKLISSAAEFQHYVLTPEVLELIDGPGGRASLNALHECGIKSMPHRAITIEYDLAVTDNEYKIRQFVVLISLEGLQGNRSLPNPDADALGTIWYLHEGKYLEAPPVYTELTLTKVNNEWGTKVDLLQAPWADYDLAPKGVLPDLAHWTSEAETIAAVWNEAQLLLCTKGMAREVVTSPGKLNRSRAKSGKATIPTHTVLRIGKVYDRQGRETVNGGTHKRVHWRAGHARNQAIGPGRTKHKLVYIQPMLINYDPATDEKPVNIPHMVTT